MIREFLFSESAVAAAEIVDAVIPAADEVTKEEVADAAAQKAEEITDAVNAAAAEAGEPLTESEYAELMTVVAQDIYTNVMAEVATAQSMYAMEELFAEGDASKKSLLSRAKGTAKTVAGHTATHAVAGSVGGAVIADRIAKKRGYNRNKARLIGALIGGTTAGGGSYLYKRYRKNK